MINTRFLKTILFLLMGFLCVGVPLSAQSVPVVVTGGTDGITQDQAAVYGTVNASGAAASVYFQYGTSDSYGLTMDAVPGSVTGSADTSVSAVLYELDAHTTYHYRLVAVNSAGTTYGADMTFTTANRDPVGVTNAATNVTASGATLNGEMNGFGETTAITFEYGADTNYGNSVTAATSPISSPGVYAVTAAVTDLNPDTAYHFRIKVENAVGTAYGEDRVFTTGATTPPTATTTGATQIGASTAQLNGTVNANNNDCTVTIEYGTDTAYGTSVTANPSSVTGADDTAVHTAIDDLVPNTLYHYRIVVTDTQSRTVYGGDAYFSTLPLPPTAATGSATAVTTGGAQLNALVNPNDDSTTVTFEYGLDTAYGTTVTAAQSPVVGTEAVSVNKTISDLQNNITYHYRVVAVNGGGTTYGADMTFTTGKVAPTAVTLAASDVTTTAAQLNGTVNANAAETAVSFEYGLDTTYGKTYVAVPGRVSGTAETAVTLNLTDLTPNTTYHYRLKAVNAGGTAYGDDMTFTTRSAPAAVTLAATSVHEFGATLNGTVNANNGDTVVTFEYGTTTEYGALANATPALATGNTNTAVSAVLTGLNTGTLYHYRVVGENADGVAYGEDMTFTPAAPTPPQVVTGSAVMVLADGATLNGVVNANNDETAVSFEYGLDTGYGTLVAAVPGTVSGAKNTAVTVVLTGLANNTTYHYRLVGTNGSGTANGADRTFTTSSQAGVLTKAADSVTAAGAVLNARVNANSNSYCFISFQYGPTTAYGAVAYPNPNNITGAVDTEVSAPVSNLTAGTTYHFRIMAQTPAGTVFGEDLTFTTPSPPTAVTQAATAVGTVTATLNGTVNPQGNAAEVTFEYGLDTNYGKSASAYQSPVSGVTDTHVSFDLQDLAPNTTYHYRVKAVSGSLVVYGADEIFSTVGAPPSAVTRPAGAFTPDGATLKGLINPNYSLTTITFQYGTDEEFGSSVSAVPATADGGTEVSVSAVLGGLAAGTTYYYRVVGQNSAGIAYGDTRTFSTGAAAPTAVTGSASGITSTSVTLNGIVNANNDNTAVSFEFGAGTNYGRSVPASPSTVTGATATPVSLELNNLIPDTTYHFRVVAVNGGGTVYGADGVFTTVGDNLPAVATADITAVGIDSAVGGGTVTIEGSAPVTARGVVWSTVSGPTTADAKTADGTGAGVFTSSITPLTPGVIYYVRAYAVSLYGTVYGEEKTFTTKRPPVVVTAPVTGITLDSAVGGGTVTDEGDGSVSVRGVCWSTSPVPTVANAKTEDGSGPGAFTSAVGGLAPNTTYYLRAYAVGAYAVAYGAQVTFTTPALPLVTTAPVGLITADSAVSGGTVVSEGGAPVTARGVVWSTAPDPTLADNVTADGAGPGAFTSTITGLDEAATYYVRAYAVNAYGTVYGDTFSFTTQAIHISVTLTAPLEGDYVSGTVAVAADVSLTFSDSTRNSAEAVTVSKVAFYIDDVLLSEDTVAPYQASWDTTQVSDGSHAIKAVAHVQAKTALHQIAVFVLNHPPVLQVSPTGLIFTAVEGFGAPGSQSLTIANSGGGTLDWNLTFSASWLSCTPASGTGDAVVDVAVDPAGLTPGTYTDTITVINSAYPGGSQQVAVTLEIKPDGTTEPPFGAFESPQHLSVVHSNVAFSGWALDDVETVKVSLYRNPIGKGENKKVWLGDAVFVDGARPDIAALYPDYPLNTRAAWSFMLLTDTLPVKKGKGTFVIFAYAQDLEGNVVKLGSKVIFVDNTGQALPFGEVLSPADLTQVEDVSVVTTAWALAPQPHTIPVDGSTITVSVNGRPVGNPLYNQYNEGVAALFPGFNNSEGAGASFTIDTTSLRRGLHTICWTVVDDAGNEAVIGRRFFINKLKKSNSGWDWFSAGNSVKHPVGAPMPVLEQSRLEYDVPQRLEFQVCETVASLKGFMVHNGMLAPLPVGSTLDHRTGRFYWDVDPAFCGTYHLVFVMQEADGQTETRNIRIVIGAPFISEAPIDQTIGE